MNGTTEPSIQGFMVPVLVDFWGVLVRTVPLGGSARCEVARDLAGQAVVLKGDTERFAELASRYNVRGIPNFAVFSRGSLRFQQALGRGQFHQNSRKTYRDQSSISRFMGWRVQPNANNETQ